MPCPCGQGNEQVEHPIVSEVAHDTSGAKITVVGVPDKPGEAAAIFRAVAGAGADVDMVTQNISGAGSGRVDITFTTSKSGSRRAVDALERQRSTLGFDSLRHDDQIARLTLVGAGMKTAPGITADFFTALSDVGVGIELISTSEIRISAVTRVDDVNEAVRAVRAAFGLDSDVKATAGYGSTER